MPRKARIDSPGALHHIICRGIERRKIYTDDTDRNNFLDRLEPILVESLTPCYGWALMPNHFHLLLKTGKDSISTIMRRVLTGYAISFNRRHRRSGRLFQNRFKSILCQEDAYLKQLVGYIHLNPLRSGIVKDFKTLSTYPYGGHSVIMGNRKIEFQDIDYVLQLFGGTISSARRNYREYVRKGIELGRRTELVGGGLLRSSGGWSTLKAMSRARIHQKGDERILGDDNFVREALAAQKEKFERRYWLEAHNIDLDFVVQKSADIFDILPKELLKPGKQPSRVKARSLTCYWSIRELGISGTEVSKLLGLSQSAVSRGVARGEKLVQAMNLSLEK